MKKNKYGGYMDKPGWTTRQDSFKRNCYVTWMDMLKRCHDLDYQQSRPTYQGCSHHPDFYYFSKWYDYFSTLPNFSQFKLDEGKGWSLDKDIIQPGNKVYTYGLISIVSVSENSSESMKRNCSKVNQSRKYKSVMGTNLSSPLDIIILSSCQESSKLGFDPSCVSKCCRGLLKQHKGYAWKYV